MEQEKGGGEQEKVDCLHIMSDEQAQGMTAPLRSNFYALLKV